MEDAFSKTADRAKGLAILLVVLGHMSSPLGGLIYSFHVPMFFFLAGLFIKTSYSEAEYVKKGLRRLIVPFLIFGFVGFLSTLLKNILLHRPIEPLSESVAGLLYWSDAEHMHHYGLVLWFLPALFWGRMGVYLLFKRIHLPTWLLFVLAVTLAWLAVNLSISPLGFDKGLIALPWIAAGYIFSQNRKSLLSANAYFLMTLFASLLILTWFMGIRPLDLANKNIGDPALSIPYTIATTYGLLLLLHRVGEGAPERLLRHFGRDSLLVLVLHAYTNNAADILVKLVTGSDHWFATFSISIALVYMAILAKYRYPRSMIFRYF